MSEKASKEFNGASNGFEQALREIVLGIQGLETPKEQETAQLDLARRAYMDSVTQLPNRRFFGEKLEQALGLSNNGQSYVVLYIDLNGFKPVNDQAGHVAGDEALREVGTALKEAFARRETDTIARLGGDEFAVLVGGRKDEIDPKRSYEWAEKTFENFVFSHQGRKFPIGAGIGILPVEAGMSVAGIMDMVDKKMYIDKALRKTGVLSTPQNDLFPEALNEAIDGARNLDPDYSDPILSQS